MNELINYNRTNTNLASENRGHQIAAQKGRQNKKLVLAAESMFQMNNESDQKKIRAHKREQTQNENLAKAMQKTRNDQERQERDIQRICEASEELKGLESKLKLAYMNKERAKQMEEAAIINKEEAYFQKAQEDQMEIDRQNAVLEQQYVDEARLSANVAAKRELEFQMDAAHFQAIQEAELEAEKDKAMVENVMRKIEEEDYTDFMQRQKKVADTNEAVQAYKRQQQDILAENRRRLKMEEDKILSYSQQKGAREASIKATQDAKKAAEEARFKKIEAQMARERAEKEEFENLRNMLWEEETENRLREQERQKQENHDRTKQEMIEANRKQTELRNQMKEFTAMEEQQLRDQMLKKFEEDKRLDDNANQRRNEEREVYKWQIEEAKKQRNDMYLEEKTNEAKKRQALQEEEDFKQKVIEAARIRLLKQHAQALGGFLPKGVLSKTQDLEMLAQFDTDGDGTLDANEIAAAKRAFMRYDRDGDGNLDQAEAQDALDALRRGHGDGFA